MAHRSSLRRDDPSSVPAVAYPVLEGGRLGVYVALGAWAGAVPLPWVPDSLVRRVRGAVAQDVTVRHGVSLTPEGRDVLSDTSGPDAPHGVLANALRFVGLRLAMRTFSRVGPARFAWPVRSALQTYVLGRLLDRYLQVAREERAVRIDGALLRAVTIEAPPYEEPAPIDDQRDATTAFLDGLLALVAGTPGRLADRLDAAFDDLVAHGHG